MGRNYAKSTVLPRITKSISHRKRGVKWVVVRFFCFVKWVDRKYFFAQTMERVKLVKSGYNFNQIACIHVKNMLELISMQKWVFARKNRKYPWNYWKKVYKNWQDWLWNMTNRLPWNTKGTSVLRVFVYFF